MKAAIAAVIVLAIALPVGILLILDPQTQAAATCSSSTTGPGPSSVNGIPANVLPIAEAASQQFGLGSDGWAYVAAINDNESDFDQSTLPGVHSGENSADAAGPMQMGNVPGGAAGDSWDTYKTQIPSNVSGGAQPPSVYNETDAVYAGAAYLKALGAPGDWQGALRGWNDFAPEIQFVNEHVALWTSEGAGAASGGTGTGTGTQTVTGGATTSTAGNTGTSTTPVAVGDSGNCNPVSGPTSPGQVSSVGKDGLASIPQQAPAQVQEMLQAGNELINYPYSWGGGYCPAAMKSPPGPGGAGCPGQQENGGPGYDCASSTSFVLWGGGLGQSLLNGSVHDSYAFAGVGQPGKGQWVTYYYGYSGSEGHAFIEVDGVVMDTVHGSPTTPAGTGPRWQPASEVQFELSTGSFTAEHPPGF